MIVHQTDEPIMSLMTNLPPCKPFRDETAVVFLCQGPGLVGAHLPRSKQLPIQVLWFDLVAVDQRNVLGRFQQTERRDDGRANAPAADNVVHSGSFLIIPAMSLPSLLGGLVICW